MYSLKEYWRLSNHPMPNGAWDGNVASVVYDAKKVLKTNETRGFLDGYGFHLVLRGSMTIIYNNLEITVKEGDLYTSSPGFEVRVPSVSADFRCLSLLVDEQFALSLPSVRDAIRMAHFPLVELTAPVLPIQAEDRRRLQELIQMIMHYQQAGLPQMNESMKMLFNLFLIDLSAIQEHSIQEHRFPKRVEEIFLEFLHLLLIYLISKPKAAGSMSLQKEAVENMKKAALMDTSSVMINMEGRLIPVEEAVLDVLSDMAMFFEPMCDAKIMRCIADQRDKILFKDGRYAVRVEKYIEEKEYVRTVRDKLNGKDKYTKVS